MTLPGGTWHDLRRCTECESGRHDRCVGFFLHDGQRVHCPCSVERGLCKTIRPDIEHLLAARRAATHLGWRCSYGWHKWVPLESCRIDIEGTVVRHVVEGCRRCSVTRRTEYPQ